MPRIMVPSGVDPGFEVGGNQCGNEQVRISAIQ